MFNKILVVCVGNICRSPIGEALLKDHFREKKQVASAGVQAMVGNPADATSLELMDLQGIDASSHKAQQLTKQMAVEYDVILVMEKRHIQDVTRIAPSVSGKTFLIGKWIGDKEIPDPYKRDRIAFEYAYDLIEQGIKAWTKYL